MTFRSVVNSSASVITRGEYVYFANMWYQGGEMYCIEPRKTLFNDLAAVVAESWIPTLQCQPATNWTDVIEYAAWTDIPSAYLVCENDAASPMEKQLQFAELAGSDIEHCDAGHMVMLSQPEVVVEFIRRAAGEKI
jgi:pimeloyl-ACP methyl ester carboxylesterase